YNKDGPCPKCGAPPSEFVDVQNTEGYDDYRQRVEQAERGLYEALGLVYDVPDEADLAGAAEDDDPEGFFVLAIEGEDEPASDDDPAPASQCDPTGDAIWGADI
ncbi:MAG: hypothetical protein KKB13_30060, partial [Chloroflexi bacterium]|nr:hypothetical protein [Chloroflexota bacterium]